MRAGVLDEISLQGVLVADRGRRTTRWPAHPRSLHPRGNQRLTGPALPVAGVAPYAGAMRIANPMYDAAFKYLMDDDTSARLLVGAVLGEEVESLQALPQERAARPSPAGEPPSGELLTVRRVDFAATVRTASGDRLRVLVEVQKARFTDEVMRFREYLGRHYADRANYDEGADGRRRHRPLRAIYILGECLPRTEATVLQVSREYLDGVTGQRLSEREEFVEALSHDCWVVQVPLLASRRRTDLERLLSVFDQELQVAGNRRVLEVDAGEVPERYAPVLRRLAGAATSVEVSDSMALEDEVSETWGRMKRESAAKDAALAAKDAELVEKDAALAEKDAALTEKEAALAEKDTDLAERDAALAEKDAALAREREDREAAWKRVIEMERRLAELGHGSGNP